MEYDITLDQILEKDNGRAFLEEVYPKLSECFSSKSLKVSLRDNDDTPSVGVFQHESKGWWMLKDFGGGGDNKAKTPHQVCMDFYGLNFRQALEHLAGFYGIAVNRVKVQALRNSRPATSDDVPKKVTIGKFKEFTIDDAMLILSPYAWKGIEWGGDNNKGDDNIRLKFAQELFKYYHFKSLESYEQVDKEGKMVYTFTATKDFPIYCFDEECPNGERFQKIYKPKDEKQYRFLWAGNKPQSFIHGLLQHEQYISGNVLENEKRAMAEAEAGKKLGEGRLITKHEDLTMVSGGSDALNVAALGYRVFWLNSETADFSTEDYKRVMAICYNMYNLPDIDMTGRAAATSLAFKHLDIKTIWLPIKLTQQTDGRGNPCKDVRDFLKYHTKKAYKSLFETALPFRFWEEMPSVDAEGNQKYKFGKPVTIYELNHVKTYNFLEMNGYYRYATDKVKEGYIFIQVVGNQVKKIDSNTVKNSIHGFLKERKLPEGLRNAMYKSPQLSDASLSNLEIFEPNFKSFGKDYQYIFFDKAVWKVTADKIESVKTPEIYLWDFKAIKITTTDQNNRVTEHKPSIIEDMFQITGDAKTGWRFTPLCKDSDFMNFAMNTCRIHWRAELEERLNFWQLTDGQKSDYIKTNGLSEADVKNLLSYQKEAIAEQYKIDNKFSLSGGLLSEDEVKEQELAMVNRIFSIGYMLHRYKDMSKPWALFWMDYRISEEGASNGRAGKGLFAKAFYKMLNHAWKDGRKEGMFDYEHVWEPIEKWVTDMIHIEDWAEHQPFPRLFGILTSSLISNPKGKAMVTFDYQEYGKFLIDTNFSDRYTDGSSKGRKLYGVFADYYHEDIEHYKEVRTPQSELGRLMFNDWDITQWNKFYNFMAQCLKFYLSVSSTGVKIDPPFTNIIKRNTLALMGENFKQWADNYFAGKMNDTIPRTEAYEDCRTAVNAKLLTPQGFIKKVQAWAEHSDYKFNPEHVAGYKKESEHAKYGTIKRMIPSPADPKKYTQKEYIYIEGNKEDLSDIPI